MADRFIEQSKEIANNFIQNIVFIDDKAYKNDMTNNAFSALDVSNVFAQSGKICAVYAPKSISDVNSYNTIPSNPQLSSSASFLRLNVLSSLN